MKKYTADDIFADRVVRLGLLDDYHQERVDEICDALNGLTLREICDLDIPAEDIIWVVSALADRRLRVRLGRAYAGHVLPIWEYWYLGDLRLRAYLETIDRWLDGEKTNAEVEVAREAARATWERTVANSRSHHAPDWERMPSLADVARAVANAQNPYWAAKAAADACGFRVCGLPSPDWTTDSERVWQIEETKMIIDQHG